MSVFRPLNSGESNLYVIRFNFSFLSTKTTQTTMLNNITTNNLPTNFALAHTLNADTVIVTYGKTYTSIPTLSVIQSGTDIDNIIPRITVNSTSGCTITFQQQDLATVVGTSGDDTESKWDVLVIGPVKLGVTTGNSNKGWEVDAGNDPDNVYTYMNVGVGTGNPSTTLEVAGTATYRNNVVAKTTSFDPTIAQSGSVFTIDSNGGVIAIKLPTPVLGLRYKFIIKTTDSNDITITSTSDGSAVANISFANIVVAGAAYSITSASGVLTLGDSATNHTIGDWVECTYDGTNWWWTGIAVVASSVTLA